MLEKIDRIVETHGCRKERVIAILQDIQDEFGYLPEDALRRVAERLGVPLIQVYGVATFFKAFRLKPRGRHLVTVCMGTACYVRGALAVLGGVRRLLGIEPRRAGRIQFRGGGWLRTRRRASACNVQGRIRAE